MGHSYIRIERWAQGVNSSQVKQALYLGFYPDGLSKGEVANKKDVNGVFSLNDYRHVWTIAKIYEISDDVALSILPPIKDYSYYSYGDYIQNWNRSYNIETNNCTTFAAKIFPHYGINPEPTKEHQWDVPFNFTTTVLWLYSWDLSLGAYGYSPADAGEDIRSMPDQKGVVVNTNINYSYR